MGIVPQPILPSTAPALRKPDQVDREHALRIILFGKKARQAIIAALNHVGNYVYISTEMEGYLGNILVTYDIRDPRQPKEVSRWWLPGQHVAGGETPTWHERSHRLHHALRRGDRMWAGVWQAGMRIVDVSDPSAPQEAGHFIPEPVSGNPAPQSNDVFVDRRGLIYLTDRNAGFDILEFRR